MKRRDALKTLGALAGAGAAARFLPACDDDGGDSGPGSITHIVCLMQENRTYDHMLGARSLLEGKPGDGLRAGMFNLDRDGKKVEIFAAPDDLYAPSLCVPDPPHGWEASRAQFAGGANTGFLIEQQKEHGGDVQVMQYLTRKHVPVTWALADKYTTCDRYFASVMGPTWPNRMYWHSATSNGLTSNKIPDGGFTWDTIYDRLMAKGVDWAYYYGNVPVLAIVDRLTQGNHLRDFEKFFEDAKAGTLPPVTYIDPAFGENDSHPPSHVGLGEQLIASIYTALATSPHWKHCLFVVTYDEHGGFFDHVAPPKTVDDRAAEGFDQMGFRVPTIVIGPYVKEGVVSTVYDHTSVLRHIENMFELAPLNARTTAATDLSDCIDTERLAAGDASAPITLPAIELDASRLGAACHASSQAADREDPVLDWFASTGDRYAHLDRRAGVEDYLFKIGDYLDRHNAGRIRRDR